VSRFFADHVSDDRGVRVGLWTRRTLLIVFAVIVLLALMNRFGQRPTRSLAAGPGARLSLSAPKTVRGGLFFQSRVEIRALRAIQYPRLVLDEGWLEGMQVNSIEPAPASESSRDGLVVLSYDSLDVGDVMRIWLQFEVDPTLVGRHSYDIALDDERTELARISRSLTVLP
jgi:hypothetical protein